MMRISLRLGLGLAKLIEEISMVAMTDGLRWTRTIRRMPFPLDAEVLS